VTDEANVPPGWRGQIIKWIDERVAAFASSGFLRNARITGGAGLSIVDGGRIALVAADGTTIFYVGPVLPRLPDDTRQPGWLVTRADGTRVLALYDADTSDGVLRQALNWYDRAGNIVLADDTDGGQGLARPWVPGVWERARHTDWPLVTSTSFETVYRAKMPKQNPRLFTSVWAWNDTGGATGEVRVMVSAAQLGSTVTTGNAAITEYSFGPAAVAGSHTGELTVEIQARIASGGGGLRIAPSRPPDGRQT
jgi:hypothetical protein